MALLDICKRVMAEVGWPVPSGIAANTDATAQQIFAIANTEVRQLSELFSWPHLEVEYQFPTVAAQSIYIFPADFRVLAQQSLFDASEYFQLKGSVSVQEWHLRRFGLLANLSRTAFRLAYPLGAPAIHFSPAPTTVRTLVSVYNSSEYVWKDDDTSLPLYVADTDTSKIPEQYVELGVKWRFRRAKGLDFSVELAEYNSTIRTQYAKYMSQAEIPVGGYRPLDVDGLTSGYVAGNGFGI